jgi:hypothetical protein
MPCEHYKNALIEAAANGAQAEGDLRVHLDTCAACRATLAQEQAFFSSIDAGLHVTANAEVPASLLPRVRARLDEEIAPHRRWTQPMIFAAASVALAFVIFLFARPHHASPDSQAKQTPQFPVSETPVTDDRHPNSALGSQIVSFDRNNSQMRVQSTLLRPVSSSQAEVLVPPDEREAFARFVVVMRERREVAVALVTPATPTKDESASLEPLQINGLEIKPLEERQTEASDGAGQEQ